MRNRRVEITRESKDIAEQPDSDVESESESNLEVSENNEDLKQQFEDLDNKYKNLTRKVFAGLNSDFAKTIANRTIGMRMLCCVFMFVPFLIIVLHNNKEEHPKNYLITPQFKCSELHLNCQNFTSICNTSGCRYCFDVENKKCTNPTYIYQDNIWSNSYSIKVTVAVLLGITLCYNLIHILVFSCIEYSNRNILIFDKKELKWAGNQLFNEKEIEENLHLVLKQDVQFIKDVSESKQISFIIGLLVVAILLAGCVIYIAEKPSCDEGFVNCYYNPELCAKKNCETCFLYMNSREIIEEVCRDFKKHPNNKELPPINIYVLLTIFCYTCLFIGLDQLIYIPIFNKKDFSRYKEAAEYYITPNNRGQIERELKEIEKCF